VTHFRTAIAAGTFAFAFAACSSFNGATTPVAGTDAADRFAAAAAHDQTLDVRLRIVIPAPHGVHTDYVSPSTKSLVYVITQAGTAVAGGSGYVNLSPSSPQCTPTVPTACTVTIPLQVSGSGTYAFALATYDAPQTGSSSSAPCTPPSTDGCAGNLLSQDLESQALVEGRLNTVAFTLGGIPAGIKIAPVSPGYLTGGGSGTAFALTLYGAQTQTATVDALDADGNTIIGAGKPAVAVASADTRKLVVVPTSVTSNVYGLRAVTSGRPPVVSPGNVGLTVTATPAENSGGSAVVVSGTVNIQHKIVYVTTQGGAGTVLEYFDDNGRWSVRLDLSPFIWPLALGGIATAGASPAAYVATPTYLASCPPQATAGAQCRVAATGLFAPFGVAADAQQNVYVAQGIGTVLECPAGGGHRDCKVAARFIPLDAAGIALDAARTLYVAKPLSGKVAACPAGGGTFRSCSTKWTVHGAYGIAVTAAGNAFVTSPHAGKLYTCTATGTCSATFSVHDASAVAADAAGAAYVVDQARERIYECTTACTSIVDLSGERLQPRWITVVPAP